MFQLKFLVMAQPTGPTRRKLLAQARSRFMTGLLATVKFWVGRLFQLKCNPYSPKTMHLRNLLVRPPFIMFYLTFLLPETTIAQRIVRAKRTLTEARVPFEVPRGPDLAARLSSVLEVIYLIFNEGYTASEGDTLQRTDLSNEAIRLTRDVHRLLPRNGCFHEGGWPPNLKIRCHP